MCGAVETVIFTEQGQDVHLMDKAGRAISLNRVMMAGVAMMLVMGAGFTAIKAFRQQRRLNSDVERANLLRSQYEHEEGTETEDEEIPRGE